MGTVPEELMLPWPHRVGDQKSNADQKSLETVFTNVICRQAGDKFQSKFLFLTIFDLRSSMVFTFSIAANPMCWHFLIANSICYLAIRGYVPLDSPYCSTNLWLTIPY